MFRKDFQHLDDEALLEYYHATRNLDAFRQLYARYKDCLYRYCTQMNFSAAGAVLEELWRGLLERPPELCGRLLRTWLFIRVDRLLRTCAGSDAGAPQEGPAPDNPLLNGLQQLPRIERNILLLHLECQLPLATVADIERLSLKACREHYRRGRERLEEVLYGPQRQPWRIEEVSV